MNILSLSWLAFAAGVWILTAILVPGERIGKLFHAGLVGGFLLAFVENLLGVLVLGLWRFGPDILPFMGIPLAVPIAWTAEVILYLHYLPEQKLSVVLYTVAFGVITVILDYFFVKFGMRINLNWNLWSTFILGLISHALVFGYYFITYPEAKKQLK